VRCKSCRGAHHGIRSKAGKLPPGVGSSRGR
jgi:hypothetical protein